MNAELNVVDEVATLRITGELDAYTAPQVREQLVEVLGGDVRWVLVDLRQTEFIDSLFLSILVGAGKRAGQKAGDIAVVCDREHLLRVFSVSGTRELLNVVETMEDAEELIAAWQQARPDEADAGREV